MGAKASPRGWWYHHPAKKVAACAKSDTVAQPTWARAVYVSATGDVKIAGRDQLVSEAVTIPVVQGQVLPIEPGFIWATGTTATVFLLGG